MESSSTEDMLVADSLLFLGSLVKVRPEGIVFFVIFMVW